MSPAMTVDFRTASTAAPYQDSHLQLDPQRGDVRLDTRTLVLTRKEMELLSFLVRHEGEIVPRAVLLMQVWGYSTEIRTRTLDVHIRRLRRKLGPYSERYIETVFNVGYRFQRYRQEMPFAQWTPALSLPISA